MANIRVHHLPSSQPPRESSSSNIFFLLVFGFLLLPDSNMEMEDGDPIRLQPLPGGLAEFNKWLEERRFQGLYLHPCLAIIHHPRWQYGIGAYMVGNLLTDGTVVARIPKEFILSIRTTSSHNLRAALELESIKGILGLTIAYIYESCRTKESPFYGYLSCFTCPDVPRLWTDDQRVLLSGTEIDAQTGLSMVLISFLKFVR